jgi:hypothetical protein
VLQLRAIFLVDLEIVELVFYEALGLGGVVEQTLRLEQFVFCYAHLHPFFGFFFLDKWEVLRVVLSLKFCPILTVSPGCL